MQPVPFFFDLMVWDKDPKVCGLFLEVIFQKNRMFLVNVLQNEICPFFLNKKYVRST